MATKVERVLLLDGINPVCAEVLQKAGIEAVIKPKVSKEELLADIKNYDGMVVRSATKVTSEVMAASNGRLKIVGRAGVGVDNIEVEEATKKGVIVMNTPGGNTLSAAELTCALICALSRSVAQASASLKAGNWDRKAFMGSELYGKTLAIVGLGRIGREVAKRMQSFGMVTIGYDPMIPGHVTQEWGVESMALEELWPKADYITVHTPLLPHTRNLINDAVLSQCRRGVRVVNVARGGIVDEAALLAALDDGRCAGAALDVFVNEPPTDFTLCQHPKVICTPHLGANTKEAQTRVAVEIAEQMVDMVQGRQLVGVVNAPALTNATSEACRPWIELAQALGLLAGRLSQPTDTPSITVTIDLFGSEVSKMNTFLGSAVLVGLLKESSQTNVNLVNAPLLAQEAGVAMSVNPRPSDAPAVALAGRGAVQLVVKRGATTHTLLGCVSGGQPSLYSLDGCVWEAGLTLGRNMLFFTSSPHVTPLAAIATHLATSQAPFTSLSSATPSKEASWHVARTPAVVENTLAVPDARFVAQVSF